MLARRHAFGHSVLFERHASLARSVVLFCYSVLLGGRVAGSVAGDSVKAYKGGLV